MRRRLVLARLCRLTPTTHRQRRPFEAQYSIALTWVTHRIRINPMLSGRVDDTPRVIKSLSSMIRIAFGLAAVPAIAVAVALLPLSAPTGAAEAGPYSDSDHSVFLPYLNAPGAVNSLGTARGARTPSIGGRLCRRRQGQDFRAHDGACSQARE